MENSPNLNINKKKEENLGKKEFNYIYFNFKHKKNKHYKISLSSNYNDSDNLELIEEKLLDNNLIEPLVVKVYRFNIVPDLLKKKNENNEFEIDVILEEENGTKYNYTIRFKDIDRDFYEYNLKIERINILPLELVEQFEIYADILRKKYKKSQNTKENGDFILSSLLPLTDEVNKYDLLFYLSIFLQCFSTDYIQNLLLAFDPKKIKEIGLFPEKKLKPIKNIINELVKSPEQIYIKNEESRLETIKLFYTLALYFNLNFQKEKIKEMFENELICQYLYDNLLRYNEFFKDLTLPPNYIIKLIKKAKNYKQILKILFYSGTDFAVLLEVIRDSKDIIQKFQNEEMNKNKDNRFDDYKIDIEKYVVPKKEDDLKLIFSLIEGFKMDITQKNEDLKLIKFSSLIFEKYSEFYNEIDINKLLILKHIVDSIKKIDENFHCECNLEEKIHKTGKIKNDQILELIRHDNYLLNTKFNEKICPPQEILDQSDESLIKDKNKFSRDLNINNFNSMLEPKLEDLSVKTSFLIKEMKDFGQILKFYNINQENSNIQVIKILQTRFIELLPTYNKKICPNFIKDVVQLIYLIDKNNIDIKKFLSEIIEKKLNVKTVNDIYINLTEKHKDLSKESKKIIVKYFTEYKENSDPVSLAYLIDKCNNIANDIFSNIN